MEKENVLPRRDAADFRDKKGVNMKLQRILTGLIGFPIVAAILILGNKYIIDVLFAIVALISIHEYFIRYN